MTKEQILLICLMEECNEVSQRCSKALRFGLNEIQEGQDFTNKQRIEYELDDLFTVANQLSIVTGMDGGTSSIRMKNKIDKLEKYFRYSKELGILQ